MAAPKKMELTADRLRHLLDYNKETGVFTWRQRVEGKSEHQINAWNAKYAGKPAGCRAGKRIVIAVDGEHYLAHRLAWLYVKGNWPEGTVDHKNGIPSENWFENLRDVTNQVNNFNKRVANKSNKTGFLGVSLHQRSGKYVAFIEVDAKSKYLGLHATPEEAHSAYVAAKRVLHADGCTI